MNNDNFQMYTNSGYNNKRNRTKSLILDIKDGTINGTERSYLGDASEFNIKLLEPLKIDKHSAIYLDHLITFNSNLSNTMESSAFCLKINEFNIQTNVASEDTTDQNNIFNSILIPNENNNVSNYFGAVIHKGKKLNYVCDINPETIYNLSGTISNINGTPAFHGGTNASSTIFTYAITGISTWSGGDNTSMTVGDEITIINPGSSGDQIVLPDRAYIVTNSEYGASTIIFTSSKSLTASLFDNPTGPASISMTVGGRTAYVLTSSVGGFKLKKDNARFIAEFSIVALE